MRILMLLMVCIAFASCGPKSNEELAKELIEARLKATLPDFSSYESVDYSSTSTAFLSFEESDIYLANSKAIKAMKDSAIILEGMVKKNPADTAYNKTIRELTDSIQSRQQSNGAAKQAFVPEKLGKISHAFKVKDASGKLMTKRIIYYFDEKFTRIIKELEAISQPIKI